MEKEYVVRMKALSPAEMFGEEKEVKRYIRQAYCNSITCGGFRMKDIAKKVVGMPDYCKDCGSALYYKRQRVP